MNTVNFALRKVVAAIWDIHKITTCVSDMLLLYSTIFDGELLMMNLAVKLFPFYFSSNTGGLRCYLSIISL